MRVFISDINDNKPVFAQRLYEVGVDEDADVGLAVVTVSANDEDEGTLQQSSAAETRFYRFQSLKVKAASQPHNIIKAL